MRKLLASLLFVLSFSGLMAGSAQAHHVIGIDVDVTCEGYAGEAQLNVFDEHKYQVTAPGFDTGVVTTPPGGDGSTVVTVPFSGEATSGTVTATIFTPSDTVEGTESKPFALEEDCDEPETEQTPSPPPPTTPPPPVAPSIPAPPVAESPPAELPPAAVPADSGGDEVKGVTESRVAGAEEVREDVLPAELARTGPAAVALYLTGLGLAMLVVALLAHVAASRRRRASQ